MSGDDRLAVLSTHKRALAKRILDSFHPGPNASIEDHFNSWVAKHIEPEGNGTRELTDVERRMLFFDVCYTLDLKTRVTPGRDGRPDRWSGTAEPTVAPASTTRKIATPDDVEKAAEAL